MEKAVHSDVDAPDQKGGEGRHRSIMSNIIFPDQRDYAPDLQDAAMAGVPLDAIEMHALDM